MRVVGLSLKMHGAQNAHCLGTLGKYIWGGGTGHPISLPTRGESSFGFRGQSEWAD